MTPEQARALIEEAAGRAPGELVVLGQGWHTTVLAAGDDLWRVAKEPSYTPQLARGRQILADLAALPLIPRPRWWGVARGHGVLGYARLPGEARAAGDYGAIEAEQVGAWLTQLHAVDPGALSLPIDPWPQRVEAARQHIEAQLVPQLPALVVTRLRQELKLAVRLAHQAPTVVLHADLNPEQLLFEGARLSGVLDLDDVTLGDPAWDFRLFVHGVGAGWTRLLVDAYQGPKDASFWARVATYARISPAVDVLGAAPEQQREGLRRLAHTLG